MGKDETRRTKKRNTAINLVFDASPLIYLAKIRILDKVAKIRGEKYIPQSVYNEVMKGKETGKGDAFLLDDFVNKNIFRVTEASDKHFLSRLLEIPSIDYADAETLAVAKETKGTAIIDDSHARTIAEIEGVECRGSIFILFTLCRNKVLNRNQIKEYLDTMINLGWRCSTELYAAILEEIKNL